MTTQSNYELSNSVQEVGNINQATIVAFNKAMTSPSAKSLQDFANALGNDLELKPVKVSFSGHQEVSTSYSRSTGVAKTTRRFALTEGSNITIFKYMAKTKKEVLADQAVSGLIYEVVKMFDEQVLGLDKAIRTKGYYNRVNDLKAKLGEVVVAKATKQDDMETLLKLAKKMGVSINI